MFSILTLVCIHVLYCDGGTCTRRFVFDVGTCTCLALRRWYVYMFFIVTVECVHVVLYLTLVRVHTYFVTVLRAHVLYCDNYACTCFVL